MSYEMKLNNINNYILNLFAEQMDEDPLKNIANLFDLMIVFALGLLLAIVSYIGLPELLSKDEKLTLIKYANGEKIEIIEKKAEIIKKYYIGKRILKGEGKKIGTLYQLKGGEIIYVPEE